jgi:hypothetical protein
MTIKRINNTNATEVNTGNGLMVLYSYQTPVAIRKLGDGQEWHTSKKHSVTTSRHLNDWCSPDAVLVPQETIEKILRDGPTCIVRETHQEAKK